MSKWILFFLLLNSVNVLSQRRSYDFDVKEDSCWYYFGNELSELIFNWIENDKELASKRRSRIEAGFTRTVQNPQSSSLYDSFTSHRVKFKISFSKVKDKMYSKIIDTINLKPLFIKHTHNQVSDTAISDTLFRINKCYVVKSTYKSAKYLIDLNGEPYLLKVTRQGGLGIIKEEVKEPEITEEYLKIFLINVNFDLHFYDKDIAISYGFIL